MITMKDAKNFPPESTVNFKSCKKYLWEAHLLGCIKGELDSHYKLKLISSDYCLATIKDAVDKYLEAKEKLC